MDSEPLTWQVDATASRLRSPTLRGSRRVRPAAARADRVRGEPRAELPDEVRRERVAKLMVGLLAQVARLGGSVVATELNGQPGVMFVDEEGRIAAVMSLEIPDGVIQTIRGITNPDKLAHLGPVADLRAILRRGRTAE